MAIQTCKLLIASNKQELENHGTPMFPCARYSCDLEQIISHDLPWHWHEEVEIIVVQNGSMKLQLNGSNYTLNEGEGFFINSNSLHNISINGKEGCVINSFVFHTNLIAGPIESIFNQRFINPLTNCEGLLGIPFQVAIPWHTQVLQYINEAFMAYDSEDFAFELLVRERLSHVWYLILRNSSTLWETVSINEGQDSIRIKEMLNFIHQHFAELITIQQIAKSTNLSERECLRCFQKTIGTAPIQYLMKYRISIAARLLITSNVPITTICDDTGFDSPSYFSKIFKRFMGCTPTFYRNSSS